MLSLGPAEDWGARATSQGGLSENSPVSIPESESTKTEAERGLRTERGSLLKAPGLRGELRNPGTPVAEFATPGGRAGGRAGSSPSLLVSTGAV